MRNAPALIPKTFQGYCVSYIFDFPLAGPFDTRGHLCDDSIIHSKTFVFFFQSDANPPNSPASEESSDKEPLGEGGKHEIKTFKHCRRADRRKRNYTLESARTNVLLFPRALGAPLERLAAGTDDDRRRRRK